VYLLASTGLYKSYRAKDLRLLVLVCKRLMKALVLLYTQEATGSSPVPPISQVLAL